METRGGDRSLKRGRGREKFGSEGGESADLCVCPFVTLSDLAHPSQLVLCMLPFDFL